MKFNLRETTRSTGGYYFISDVYKGLKINKLKISFLFFYKLLILDTKYPRQYPFHHKMLAAFLTENFIAIVQNANVVTPCSLAKKKLPAV
ncbi:hypothetical protein G893_01097 [Escherichia coli KOEGE 71 (186a)]|uniref:hypothetical protein n=1 Tax=Escherichia coli TaxID=562 RepID=UPI00039140C8|nr:hypothetical protein [Escherichia coli]EQV94722.1 hypothetical protein G893_01097 [Escherichia coli KOEGE 71 (186a)]